MTTPWKRKADLPIQFLLVVHDNGLFVEYHIDGLLYFS